MAGEVALWVSGVPAHGRAGIGIAAGLQAMIAAAGWGLPSGPPRLLGRTVVVALAAGPPGSQAGRAHAIAPA